MIENFRTEIFDHKSGPKQQLILAALSTQQQLLLLLLLLLQQLLLLMLMLLLLLLLTAPIFAKFSYRNGLFYVFKLTKTCSYLNVPCM